MLAALKFGGVLPMSIAVLQAAEDWGTAPWAIDPSRPPRYWMGLRLRYRELQAFIRESTSPPED